MTSHVDTPQAPFTAPEYVTFDYTRNARQAVLHVWTIDGEQVATVGANRQVFDVCGRCGGSGDFPSSAWNGICLGCNGYGAGKLLGENFEAMHAKIVKRVKARAAAAKRAEKKAFELAWDAAHAWNAWYQGREDVIAALRSDEYKQIGYDGEQYGWKPGFLGEMAARVCNGETLSEAQEAAVRRTLASRVERAERKQAAGHLAVVGARVEADVTIRYARDYEGQYGTRHLVTMEDADGRTLKTWSSGEFGWAAAAMLRDADGQPVTARIKGTVKAHEEYKGTPQTELTRVALV